MTVLYKICHILWNVQFCFGAKIKQVLKTTSRGQTKCQNVFIKTDVHGQELKIFRSSNKANEISDILCRKINVHQTSLSIFYLENIFKTLYKGKIRVFKISKSINKKQQFCNIFQRQIEISTTK